MKKYTLTKTDTGHKSGRFVYAVTDENGSIISTRKSDREYAACTADGSFYFGRLDLIGGGDHGKQIKFAQGWGRDSKNKMVPNMHEPNPARLENLNAIAYLVAETSAPVQEKPTMSVDELAFHAWIGEKKAQYKQWQADGQNGTIKDDANPCFLFSGTFTALLVKVANGEISAGFLASQELANRGLDKDGKWVGFAEAEKIHFPK